MNKVKVTRYTVRNRYEWAVEYWDNGKPVVRWFLFEETAQTHAAYINNR